MTDMLHDALAEVFDRYLAAYGASDANACAAFYTDDAVILSPWGPPATGHDAIAALHLEWFKEAETNKTIEIIDHAGDGDTAFCLARYRADVPTYDGGLSESAGTSLNTFMRSGGVWRIRHTSLNELT